MRTVWRFEIKTIKISASEQLESMESIACATGLTCYDSVREEFLDCVRAEYSRAVDFDLEAISQEQEDAFILWLEDDS